MLRPRHTLLLITTLAFFAPLHSQPRLTLHLDADTPLAGNVAVSVVDANVVKPDSTGDNIVSALLASSELRGKVERPLDYFKGDSKSRQDMDLLMLTQGWRRYPMNNIIEGKTAAPTDSFETSQSISGMVKSTIGSTKDITLYVTPVISGIDPSRLSIAIYGSGNVITQQRLSGKPMSISTAKMSPGVVNIAIADTDKRQVLSERLAFIYPHDKTKVEMSIKR